MKNTMEDKYKEVTILSHDEMDRIDSQIVNNRVTTSTNEDYDELIGADDDDLTQLFQKSEKIADKICKNVLAAHSINVNNKNIRIMEKAKFTVAELSVITNRYNEIHSAANETQTLKENLMAYYMSTDSTITKEDAEKIVGGLMSGVEDFTIKYKEALAEGWNPKKHVDEMVDGMTLQQRYDFLVNAISLVNTINLQTMGEMQDVQTSVNETIEKMKSGNIEVTDAVCDELQNSLTELLQSSPLMIINAEQIKEMMDAANGQTINVVDFASSQYDDYRYKNEMALAAWIEHKNGALTTLPSDTIPEALGVSIAAGVEEAHIMEEVATGSKPFEWAVKALKILGAVALTCFLGYVAFLGLALLMGAFFEASILVMGTSTIAIIAASVLSFLVCWGYSGVAIQAVTKILEWTGEAYDWVVKKLEENVYPSIKAGFTKLVSWLKSLFKKGETTATQEVFS